MSSSCYYLVLKQVSYQFIMRVSHAQWCQHSGLELKESKSLLCHVLRINQAQLIVRANEPIADSYLSLLEHYRQQRLSGVPMAYLLGYKPFYGRNFFSSPAALIPRAETEHLIDWALKKNTTNKPLQLWDMGTGSGIIAITLKLERPQWVITASDISKQALCLAKQNCVHLGAQLTLVQGNWFDTTPIFTQNYFDIIISNPPYIDKESPYLEQGDLRFEPRIALTDEKDGLAAYRVLSKEALHYLKPQGWLCVEHGYTQQTAIQHIFYEAGWINIECHKDYAGLDRLIAAQKPA